ncbi:hypothetical protein [Deinococcus petrolearius]|uniref:Uncharacterized protein n=1 Tax=Deinococcus petrolearius TaxID=1751295 RepID=A0ABW1DLX0_9DEIO
MIAFECRWLSGKLAAHLHAADATQAGQEATQLIAEHHGLTQPLVLASDLVYRLVGLYNPISGEVAAIIVPVSRPITAL